MPHALNKASHVPCMQFQDKAHLRLCSRGWMTWEKVEFFMIECQYNGKLPGYACLLFLTLMGTYWRLLFYGTEHYYSGFRQIDCRKICGTRAHAHTCHICVKRWKIAVTDGKVSDGRWVLASVLPFLQQASCFIKRGNDKSKNMTGPRYERRFFPLSPSDFLFPSPSLSGPVISPHLRFSKACIVSKWAL